MALTIAMTYLTACQTLLARGNISSSLQRMRINTYRVSVRARQGTQDSRGLHQFMSREVCVIPAKTGLPYTSDVHVWWHSCGCP